MNNKKAEAIKNERVEYLNNQSLKEEYSFEIKFMPEDASKLISDYQLVKNQPIIDLCWSKVLEKTIQNEEKPLIFESQLSSELNEVYLKFEGEMQAAFDKEENISKSRYENLGKLSDLISEELGNMSISEKGFISLNCNVDIFEIESNIFHLHCAVTRTMKKLKNKDSGRPKTPMELVNLVLNLDEIYSNYYNKDKQKKNIKFICECIKKMGIYSKEYTEQSIESKVKEIKKSQGGKPR